MVKSEVVDLSAKKSKPVMRVVSEEKPVPKADPVKKVANVEPVKVLPIPKLKIKPEPEPETVEETKPEPVAAEPKRRTRFEKGSDQAKEWAAKMREAKLAKKAGQMKETLLEVSETA